MKSRILGFVIRNVAQGIPRNPTNDWNPKSNLNRKGIRNPVPGIRNPQRGIRNPRLSWITLYQEPAPAYIECFYMTSRRPYWCPKTMKRRPCWCPKTVLWELNSFLMQTLSFVSINLHRCWPREWKHAMHEANSCWHSTTKGEGINFSLIFVTLDRTYYPSRPRGCGSPHFSIRVQWWFSKEVIKHYRW